MPGAVESLNGVLLGGGALPAPKAGVGIGAGASARPLEFLDSLVLRVRGGEAEAFDEIMRETEGRVLGLAWRLLGDRELAKDASQEAYLRAYKSLGTYRIGESFTAWMGRITANVCCNYFNKRGSGTADSQVLESIPSPDSGQAEASVLRRQHMELVQRALAALTPGERAALTLRDMEGLSTDETARILGLKPGTIRTQIASARHKVKNFCQRVLHGPQWSKGSRHE